MLKNIVVLEVNGKRGMLGQVEIPTPSAFMFANNTEQILNCHMFDEFIYGVFELTINEFVHEVNEKINNVYITFINEYNEFVCSIIIDKLNAKRHTYRVRLNDWQSSGYTFKYVDDEALLEGSDEY